MTHSYFNALMLNRQRLFWTVATRQQLERWEPLVAECVRRLFADRQLNDTDIWSAAIEHHFALVAARNLFRALDLAPASSVPINPTLRAELTEGRNLHEHWPENMPLFNAPTVAQQHRRSGKTFAARNPNSNPYNWLRWTDTTGAQLLPNVPAPALHQLLDAVETEAITNDPALSAFVPPRAASPWLHQDGEWWPKTTA
jgi:hypothetical protein